MANLPESSTFDAGVYQLETTDPVQGGPSGVSNAPLKNLTNRTKWLKDQVDALAVSLGASAPLASPTFTGDPKAPTAALGDNDTSIATSAFVQGTIGAVLNKSVAGSGTTTLTAVEAGSGILVFTGALTGNRTAVVPTSPTRSWVVRNNTTGSFTLTIKTAAGSGVEVSQGATRILFGDGTDVRDARTDFKDAALTGTPTAPTAAAGTSNTQVATTAFVQTAADDAALVYAIVFGG